MARAPFQVSVFAFRIRATVEYLLLRHQQEGYWQLVAGGGEDDETPIDAARRETYEETGIPTGRHFLRLATQTMVPKYHFKAHTVWPEDVFVIPLYYFGVNAAESEIVLSREHSTHVWVPYADALQQLRWDSDKTALWELHQQSVSTP